jgi:tetratricopeptide (TPR) repeat protein
LIFFRDVTEGIQRYLKLLEQYPDNELARFSLGKAYFDQPDFGEALKQFQIALQKKPDWMVVQILVGKCELALGHRDAAKVAFQRALELAIDQHHEGPQAEMESVLRDLEQD